MNKTFSVLDKNFEKNLDFLIQIAEINSHSYNRSGLDQVRNLVKNLFLSEFSYMLDEQIALKPHRVFDEKGRVQEIPLANSLFLKDSRTLNKPIRLLWMIHLDTVFLPEDTFHKTHYIKKNILNGPGVSDAKGGVVLIFSTLQALQESSLLKHFQIDVFFNTDEEVGSPGSSEIMKNIANNYDYAMIFEPSLPDGSFIRERKGNGNFQVKITGKASHAGREFEKGISAIHAAAFLIHQLNQTLNQTKGITFNTGKIDGGGPVNVVADLAVIRFNLRVETNEKMDYALNIINQSVNDIEKQFGVKTELLGGFSSPPKRQNESMKYLFEQLRKSCDHLKMPFKTQNSGGVCDGNKLHNFNLSNIDTLGPVGGKIHSHEEYLLTQSLKERAQLLITFLDQIQNTNE